MTQSIGPAHLSPVATVGRQSVRSTKSDGDVGFAKQLESVLAARTAAPVEARRPPAPVHAPGDDEEHEPQGQSGDHAGAPGAASTETATHAQQGAASTSRSNTSSAFESNTSSGSASSTSSAPGSNTASGSDGAPSSATPAQAPDARSDVQLAELSGRLSLAGLMETGHQVGPDGSPPDVAPATRSDTTSRPSTRAPVDARSARGADGQGVAPVATNTPDDQDGAQADSHTSAGMSDGTATTSAGPLPSGVSVIDLTTAAANASPPATTSPSHPAASAPTTTDSTAAGALAAATVSADGPADLPTTVTSAVAGGPTSASGPEVTGALAADASASTRSDRITVQVPTDQGSARIQISISNGAVAARILMSDPAGAALLSTATGELHDALIRQGFDNVSIAIPAPATLGVPIARTSTDQSSDRMPDRSPQHSFTPAQDDGTPGRPQQRPRRQRER
jgi:hypothetical protein